jgi:hypothetical protein
LLSKALAFDSADDAPAGRHRHRFMLDACEGLRFPTARAFVVSA